MMLTSSGVVRVIELSAIFLGDRSAILYAWSRQC